MVAIHIAQSEMSKLDEAIAELDGIHRLQAPRPDVEVGPGAWMKRSIHPVEDLSGLAPLMREAKVPSVDLAHTPLADLQEVSSGHDPRTAPKVVLDVTAVPHGMPVVQAPVCARSWMHRPIRSVDLNCHPILMRHREVSIFMAPPTIPQPKISQLQELLSEGDARGGPHAPAPQSEVRARTGMKRPLRVEDLRRLAGLTGDAQVGSVHLAKTEAADLDEAPTKGNAIGIPQGPMPRTKVMTRTRMKCSSCMEDLCRVAILVRNGEMIAIDISQAPFSKLNKAVPKGSKVQVAGAMRDFFQALACPGHWMPTLKGVIISGPRMGGAISSVDLNRLMAPPRRVRHGHVSVIHLAQAEEADLDELVPQRHPRGRALRTIEGVHVRAGAIVKGTVRAEDLTDLPSLMCEAHMCLIIDSQAPLTNLNELEAELDAPGSTNRPTPGGVVMAGASMNGPI